MKPNRYFRLGAWLSLLSFANSLWAVPVPKESLQRSIQILWLEGDSGTAESPANVELEKQVGHWLENAFDGKFRVREKSGVLTRSRLERERLRQELRGLSLKIWNSAFNSPVVPVGKSEWERVSALRKKLAVGEAGPDLQLSYLAEGAWNWRNGKRSAADPLLKQAVVLNPEGDILLPEGGADSGAREVFEAHLDLIVNQTKRACSLEFDSDEAIQRLWVNGFVLAPSRSLKVHPGLMSVMAYSKNGQWAEAVYSCSRSGKQNVKLVWKSSWLSGRDQAMAMNGMGEADASLILERTERGVRSYLYSPGVGVDELSAEKSRSGGGMGFSSQSFETAARKQGLLASMKDLIALEEGSTGERGGTITSEGGAQGNETKWYNSWTFWAIAGGVVAGGAIAILSSGGGGSHVGSRHGSITINGN